MVKVIDSIAVISTDLIIGMIVLPRCMTDSMVKIDSKNIVTSNLKIAAQKVSRTIACLTFDLK